MAMLWLRQDSSQYGMPTRELPTPRGLLFLQHLICNAVADMPLVVLGPAILL